MRSEVQRQEMLREVFALSAVSQSARKGSTHIVRYFNAWWEDGRLYIQTELCSNSLADVMDNEKGPLPPDLCITVLEECLLGLSLIHSHGMCHLDVKVRAPAWLSAARCSLSRALSRAPADQLRYTKPDLRARTSNVRTCARSPPTSSSRARRRSCTSSATLALRRSTATRAT